MNDLLSEICGYLRNWFLVPGGVHIDTYTVSESGTLALPFLAEGQYFRVIGSVFNDGIYKYGEGGLAEETFHGAVWALAIPPALVSIAEEIEKWNTDNAAALASPYQAESFGGYSYTLAGGGSGTDGETQTANWRNVFGAKLSRWRKI